MDRKTFIAFIIAILMFVSGVYLMGVQMKALGAEREEGTIRLLNTSKSYIILYRLSWIDHPHGMSVNPITGQLTDRFDFAGGELKPGAKYEIRWPKGTTIEVHIYCPTYVNRQEGCEDSLPKLKRRFFLHEAASTVLITPDAVVMKFE